MNSVGSHGASTGPWSMASAIRDENSIVTAHYDVSARSQLAFLTWISHLWDMDIFQLGQDSVIILYFLLIHNVMLPRQFKMFSKSDSSH